MTVGRVVGYFIFTTCATVVLFMIPESIRYNFPPWMILGIPVGFGGVGVLFGWIIDLLRSIDNRLAKTEDK